MLTGWLVEDVVLSTRREASVLCTRFLGGAESVRASCGPDHGRRGLGAGRTEAYGAPSSPHPCLFRAFARQTPGNRLSPPVRSCSPGPWRSSGGPSGCRRVGLDFEPGGGPERTLCLGGCLSRLTVCFAPSSACSLRGPLLHVRALLPAFTRGAHGPRLGQASDPPTLCFHFE